MKRILALYIMLSIIFLSSCKPKEEPKSAMEMMKEDAIRMANEQEQERLVELERIENMTDEELLLLFDSPDQVAAQEYTAIYNYLSAQNYEGVAFEPLVEGDYITYESEEIVFFDSESGDQLVTDKLKVIIERNDGRKELINEFFNSKGAIVDPKNTPGYFFFEISDKPYYSENTKCENVSTWVVDGAKGICRVWDTNKRYNFVSQDGQYLLSYDYEKYNNEKVENDVIRIPVLIITSFQENRIVEEINMYEYIISLNYPNLYYEDLFLRFYQIDNTMIIELNQSYYGFVAQFSFDIDSWKLSLIKKWDEGRA